MEWAAVIRDIIIGILIAGAVAAWILDTFWQELLLTHFPWPRRSGFFQDLQPALTDWRLSRDPSWGIDNDLDW